MEIEKKIHSEEKLELMEKIFSNRESLTKLGKTLFKKIFESTSSESK